MLHFFATLSLVLSHLDLSRIELPKSASSVLMEIVTIPAVLVNKFYFYMHQPIKAWFFEKIIVEIDYHGASLSLHFHIVLKALASY